MNDNDKRFFYSLLMLIVFIIFGSFLILSPEATISMISKTLASLIFLLSISGFIRYLAREDKTKRIDYNLIYGLITLCFSVVLFLKDNAIGVLIAPVLGVFILTNTSLKITVFNELRKDKNPFYKIILMIMLIEYLTSFAIIFNIFGEVLSINQLVGIFVIFYFVLDFVLVYLIRIIYQNNTEIKLIEGKVE